MKQTGSINAAEIGYTELTEWGIVEEVRDRAVGSGIGRQRRASSYAMSSCILERRTASATVVAPDSFGSQRISASFSTLEEGIKLHAMGRLLAKESAGTAVIGRTRGWTRSGLSSETLLADISALNNCKVAERTVVRMIRWTMVSIKTS